MSTYFLVSTRYTSWAPFSVCLFMVHITEKIKCDCTKNISNTIIDLSKAKFSSSPKNNTFILVFFNIYIYLCKTEWCFSIKIFVVIL